MFPGAVGFVKKYYLMVFITSRIESSVISIENIPPDLSITSNRCDVDVIDSKNRKSDRLNNKRKTIDINKNDLIVSRAKKARIDKEMDLSIRVLRNINLSDSNISKPRGIGNEKRSSEQENTRKSKFLRNEKNEMKCISDLKTANSKKIVFKSVKIDSTNSSNVIDCLTAKKRNLIDTANDCIQEKEEIIEDLDVKLLPPNNKQIKKIKRKLYTPEIDDDLSASVKVLSESTKNKFKDNKMIHSQLWHVRNCIFWKLNTIKNNPLHKSVDNLPIKTTENNKINNLDSEQDDDTHIEKSVTSLELFIVKKFILLNYLFNDLDLGMFLDFERRINSHFRYRRFNNEMFLNVDKLISSIRNYIDYNKIRYNITPCSLTCISNKKIKLKESIDMLKKNFTKLFNLIVKDSIFRREIMNCFECWYLQQEKMFN